MDIQKKIVETLKLAQEHPEINYNGALACLFRLASAETEGQAHAADPEAITGRCPICKCAIDEEGNGSHSADCVDFRATLGEWYKMRNGEPPYDTGEIITKIRERAPMASQERLVFWPKLSNDEAAAMIGQYAYRYSEDIRKDRDEWKAMATQFADAVKAKEAAK